MKIPTKIQHGCCSLEKSRLVESLRRCEFCATSYEDFHRCYQQAARKSASRVRACMDAERAATGLVA
jgi:hypothetical protein